MQMESSCARYFSLHNFTPPNISFIQDIVNGNLLMAQKVSKELMAQNVHEHEVFLAFWLSKYLFPSVRDTVLPEALNLAILLARGQKMALAPAVLATLHMDLHLLQNTILDLQQGKSESVLQQVCSPMYYMQVWVLERFQRVGPYGVGNIREEETRLTRWANPANKSTDYATLESGTCGKQFVWRPYVKDTNYFIAHTKRRCYD